MGGLKCVRRLLGLVGWSGMWKKEREEGEWRVKNVVLVCPECLAAVLHSARALQRGVPEATYSGSWR